MRDAWICGLREAFVKEYPTFKVFGGKPRNDSERQSGLHCGVPNWSRWELLHDVAVVELEWLDAPYAHRKVPIVRRAVWQVESEVARNGTMVAEDFGKLRIGNAENKLFIAARTLQKQNPQGWLEFFGHASFGMDSSVYLALVPSYSAGESDSNQWWQHTADVLLYRCLRDGELPQQIGNAIIANGE